MVTRIFLLAVFVATACQGKGNEPVAVASGSSEPARDAEPVALPVVDAGVAAVAEDAAKPEDPETPDPGKLIADLGAINAWQAVVDRAQLLGRRGQHGVTYGRIGPAILVLAAPEASDAGVPVDAGLVASPYVWLVDDTEGNGSLGIRVALAGREVKEGERVALGGAWHLDDAKRWYWKVDSVQALPPPPPSDLKDGKPAAPTHAVPNGDLIAGSRTISVARDGDLVYFQLVGPAPANDGDGWAVADELGNPTFALLTLPGERASYGSQDMRAPDERWVLKRGQTYSVRIGKIRKRGLDKPALIHARTGPVRVM
jgi:hypothetical protein